MLGNELFLFPFFLYFKSGWLIVIGLLSVIGNSSERKIINPEHGPR